MKKVILSLVATVMLSLSYGQTCDLEVTNNTPVALDVTGWSSDGVTNASTPTTSATCCGATTPLSPPGGLAFDWIGLEVLEPISGTYAGSCSPCQGCGPLTTPWNITWDMTCCKVLIGP